MNKKIFMIGILPVLAMVIPHAMADNQDRYNQGWIDGQNQAASDWNSHVFTVSSGGNSQCPDGHSHAYCQGWNAGYADEWNRAIQVNYGTQTQTTQGQNSDVNIKGNNNRVTVQQGQQSGDSGSGGSGDGGSGNPQCRILCSVIH